MKYRRLGTTGPGVSVIGVGTWQLGGEWGQRFTQHEVDDLLGRARTLGVNLVDTAECYGDHLAEELIGAAIHHHRADWVVATKFGHQFHPEAMGQADRSPVQLRTDHWTPTEVVGQLEASLRALQTDHVDLYQMHSASEEVFSRHDLWEALNQQVTNVRSATSGCRWGPVMSSRSTGTGHTGAAAPGAGPSHRTDDRRRRPSEQRVSTRPARRPAPGVLASCMNAYAHPSPNGSS